MSAAWAAYKPDAKRPVRQRLSPTAREGWEEAQVYIYETSPNERAVVQSVARRAKNAWTVVILDGKQPTFEKRGSAVGLIMGSMRPGTYQRESFAGRKAGAAELRTDRADEGVRRDGNEEARHSGRGPSVH